jgi:hypothetical protein
MKYLIAILVLLVAATAEAQPNGLIFGPGNISGGTNGNITKSTTGQNITLTSGTASFGTAAYSSSSTFAAYAFGLNNFSGSGTFLTVGAGTFGSVTAAGGKSVMDTLGNIAITGAGTSIGSIKGFINFDGSASFGNSALTIGANGALATSASGSFANLSSSGSGYFGNSVVVTSGNVAFGAVSQSLASTASAVTINWNNGAKQLLTASCSTALTITMTAPTGGAASLQLEIIGGAGALHPASITWSPAVKWAGGTALPATPAGEIDVVSLWWDGSQYLGTYSTAFSQNELPQSNRLQYAGFAMAAICGCWLLRRRHGLFALLIVALLAGQAPAATATWGSQPGGSPPTGYSAHGMMAVTVTYYGFGPFAPPSSGTLTSLSMYIGSSGGGGTSKPIMMALYAASGTACTGNVLAATASANTATSAWNTLSTTGAGYVVSSTASYFIVAQANVAIGSVNGGFYTISGGTNNESNHVNGTWNTWPSSYSASSPSQSILPAMYGTYTVASAGHVNDAGFFGQVRFAPKPPPLAIARDAWSEQRRRYAHGR